MVPDNFPRGKFSYGAAGAVILDVVYVEGKTTLVPVQDLVDRALGRADELRVNPADIMKLAARAGVTPLDAAHFMIAYHAAKVAVGRAIPALSAALLNAPTLWELVSGDISSQEFAARRALRDLLAIEMAGAVARRHPNPVDRHGLEMVRYYMLTAAGFAMDSPFQREVHAHISGSVGLSVSCTIRDRVLPWFRENLAR